MARVNPPAFVKRALAALRAELKGTEVDFQRLNGSHFYRLAVVSPKFKRMGVMKRQDRAWDAIDRALTKDEQMNITMILTLAPGELND